MHASFNAYALNPIYYIANLLVAIHQLENGSSTIMALQKKQVQVETAAPNCIRCSVRKWRGDKRIQEGGYNMVPDLVTYHTTTHTYVHLQLEKCKHKIYIC